MYDANIYYVLLHINFQSLIVQHSVRLANLLKTEWTAGVLTPRLSKQVLCNGTRGLQKHTEIFAAGFCSRRAPGTAESECNTPPSCHRCKSLQVKALCSSFPSPVSNSMRKESSGNLTVIPLAVPKGSARTLQQSQGPTEQKSCSPYSSLDFSESHQHDSVLANTLRKAYFAWLVCQTCPNHFWVDQEVPRSL